MNPFGEVYSRLYHIRMVEVQLPIAAAGPFLRGDEKTIDILKNENIIES